MANLKFDNFTGIFPRQGAKRLPVGAATVAQDCEFDAGRLSSIKGTLDFDTVDAGTTAIYKLRDKYWLTSDEDLFYVDSPVVQDAHGRVYFTGGDYPAYATESTGYSGWSASSDIDAMARMPSLYYKLGVPAPTGAPTVTVNSLPAAESDIEDLLGVSITLTDGQTINQWLKANLSKVATAYVYTFVSDYGEESAPSPVSAIREYYDGQTKTIGLPSTGASGVPLSSGKKRIYRVATGSSSSEYLFVAEVDYSVTSYTDETLDSELAEPLTSTYYFPPPNDDTSTNPSGPLKSLVLHPQGFLVGHAGRTIAFSEPYLPHAWDPSNQITCPADVVGLCVFSNGILVGTVDKPYVITGTSPSTMDIYPLESEQPCVSQRSMVEIGGSVLFASYEGLVVVSGNRSEVVTTKHFTRDQWAGYYPESIHAYTLDNRYIGFYTNSAGTVKGGFIFDVATGRFSELSFYAEAGYVNPKDDVLYLVEGTKLTKFERGTIKEYTWKSGEIRLHNSVLFQRFKIEADHTVSMRIQVDGKDYFARTVVDSDEMLLPSGMRGEYFTVEFKGKGYLDLFAIADEALELEP